MSLLIKALKQAERSHKQSGDQPPVSDADVVGIEPPASPALDAEPAGSLPAAASSRVDQPAVVRAHGGEPADTGAAEASIAQSRDLPATEPEWASLLGGDEPLMERQAPSGPIAETRSHESAEPLSMTAVDEARAPEATTAESGGTFDDLGAPASSDISLLEMGSLQAVEPSDDVAFAVPAPASNDVASLEFADEPPAPAREASFDLAPSPANDNSGSSGESPAPMAFANDAEPDEPVPGDANSRSEPAEEAHIETAQVVAAPKARKQGWLKPAPIAGVVGIVLGAWFGYQMIATPDFPDEGALPPTSMGMPGMDATMTMAADPMAAAAAPSSLADGPLWTSDELALLTRITGQGQPVAEGSWVAVAPEDGKVPALAAVVAPASAPAKSDGASVATVSPKNPPARAAAPVTAPTRTAPSESRPTAPAVPLPRADSPSNALPTTQAKEPAASTDAPLAVAPLAKPAARPPRLTRTLSAAERLALVKTAAYRALKGNRLDESESLYRDVLVRNPLDSDAWIGLATIAAKRGDLDLSRQQYERALTIDPNDGVAQAGLLSVTRSEEPTARESRLRNLIANGLSGPGIAFELGNALAEQSRWLEAQQAYFEASRAAPDNADYAFNLAVALDQMQQPAAAIQHYQRALSLAEREPASFSANGALQRIQALQAAASQR